MTRTAYRRVNARGYVFIEVPDHPRADSRGRIHEHIVAEAALGHYLPPGAEVHHVNGKSQNGPGTLVVCQDAAYHALLEMRTRALDACGHAGWRKCVYANHYDDPKNMVLHSSGRPGLQYTHATCRREYYRLLENGRQK